ncbi:MAG: hypothetical protein ABIK09_17770 [Pseudomonadota bacterium]
MPLLDVTRAAAPLLALLLLGGCVGTDALDGKGCDEDHPCPGHRVCRDGVCQGPGAPLCETDDDCPMGGHCFAAGGYCVSCLDDAHCDIGVCHPQVHVCIGCLEDAHCPQGVCLSGSHTCVSCRTNTDCATGLCHVVNHVCLGCKGHHQCESGVCNLETGVCE